MLGTLAACHAPDANDGGPADADEACAPILSDMVDDAAGDCAAFVTVPCGLRDGATVSLCYPDLTSCAEACPGNILYCVLAPSSCAADGGPVEGPALVECSACGAGGRRPRGMHAAAACGASEIGSHLARLTQLEHASVRAFEDLSESLARFGAPRLLIAAARRAALDERRHARMMTRLARRFGGVVVPPRVRATAPTLAALIEDDAIEGCANETFAALVATWQAAHARDLRVRTAMGPIARDETRHAALAWEILAWGAPKLGAADRARVRRRLHDALAALGRSGSLGPRARRALGHPDAATARRLADGLRARAPLV